MVILAYFLFRMFFAVNSTAIKERVLVRTAMDVSEWVCVKDTKGIVLRERWVNVNDSLKVRERRGELVVDCSFEEVMIYLKNHNTVGQWMKGVKSTQFYNDDKSLVYMIIHLPWPFSNRDLLARYSTIQMDENNCLVKVVSETVEEESKSELQRMQDYRASWRLQRLGNRRTKIVFTTFSSEPPMFPQWMQEPVLKKVFYGNLKRLREQLSNLK